MTYKSEVGVLKELCHEMLLLFFLSYEWCKIMSPRMTFNTLSLLQGSKWNKINMPSRAGLINTAILMATSLSGIQPLSLMRRCIMKLDWRARQFFFLLSKFIRLLQTIQNCLAVLPQISSRYGQQLLLTILPTAEEILPQWGYAFVLSPAKEYALLIINTVWTLDRV